MLRDKYIKAVTSGGGGGAVLPPGTYKPKNSALEAFDLLWENQTPDVLTSDGLISRTGIGTGWDQSATALVNHTGDFDLVFQFDFSISGANVMFGISLYKSWNSFENLDFCFSRGGSNIQDIYENGSSKGITATISDLDVFKISRQGMELKYYRNDILLRTATLINTCEFNIDCSFFDQGTVKNIELIIP